MARRVHLKGGADLIGCGPRQRVLRNHRGIFAVGEGAELSSGYP